MFRNTITVLISIMIIVIIQNYFTIDLKNKIKLWNFFKKNYVFNNKINGKKPF